MNTTALRRTIVAALLLALALAPAEAAKKKPDLVDPNAKSTVAWTESYGGAVKQAEEEHRPLLFKFYASWCPHCAKMDATTWVDETVGELSKGFVAVKLNSETQAVAAKRYRIQGIPVTLIAEPGGEEVLRLEGEKSPKVIAAYLKTYQKHAATIEAAFGRLRENRKDAEGNLALGAFYLGVGLTDPAIDRYEEALDHAEGELWLRACAGAATAWLDVDPERSQELVADGLTRAGDSPPAALLLAKAKVELEASGADAARPWFERVVNEHGDSEEARAARKALEAQGG